METRTGTGRENFLVFQKKHERFRFVFVAGLRKCLNVLKKMTFPLAPHFFAPPTDLVHFARLLRHSATLPLSVFKMNLLVSCVCALLSAVAAYISIC